MNEERVKLLGINLEGRLNIDFHENAILEKPSKKYHALARVCSYMNKKKRRILMNAFTTPQFCYFSLVLMSHSRTMSNRVNKIHKIA